MSPAIARPADYCRRKWFFLFLAVSLTILCVLEWYMVFTRRC